MNLYIIFFFFQFLKNKRDRHVKQNIICEVIFSVLRLKKSAANDHTQRQYFWYCYMFCLFMRYSMFCLPLGDRESKHKHKQTQSLVWRPTYTHMGNPLGEPAEAMGRGRHKNERGVALVSFQTKLLLVLAMDLPFPSGCRSGGATLRCRVCASLYRIRG